MATVFGYQNPLIFNGSQSTKSATDSVAFWRLLVDYGDAGESVCQVTGVGCWKGKIYGTVTPGSLCELHSVYADGYSQVQGTFTCQPTYTTYPMDTNDVIVEMLAEGGSRVLYGLRRPHGWLFSLDFIESTGALSESESQTIRTGIVGTFPDALVLLDRYDWIKLAPSMVHPEFRADVMSAVAAREEAANEKSRYHDRWVDMCEPSDSSSSDSDLKMYKVLGSISASDCWMYEDLD